MRQKDSHAQWGEWIARRAGYVGIKQQARLAAVIGCSVDQLSRWMQADEPPSRMRKGFDAALAAALRVDAQILFSSWRDVAPEIAPLVDAADGDLKKKVHAVVELLDADRLRKLHRRGRELLKEEMATSAA